MSRRKRPLLTDRFLTELAKEISKTYGGPEYEKDATAPESLTSNESK